MGWWSCTYHDGFASPPVLLFLDQGMGDDEDGIVDKGKSSGERDPFENSLLGVGDMVVGSPLDKIAGWVGGGQRLASRAGCSRFGDISIRLGGGDAAGGEGGQKENKHNDGVGILQDGRDGADRACIGPTVVVEVVKRRRVGGVEQQQWFGHGVCLGLGLARST